jgi:hypothetical protein
MFVAEDGTYDFFDVGNNHVVKWLPVPGWRIQSVPAPLPTVQVAPNQIN